MPDIAILLASKRPEFLAALFKNLRETVENPKSIEIHVKADQEDPSTIDVLEREAKSNPFLVKSLIAPKGEGYFDLNRYYNQMIGLAEADTYFFNVINDELRFLTSGWDQIIASKKRLFLDDIFCLRISSNRHRNYYSLYDCCWAPENYGFYTHKWLELVGGWGDKFWGVDSWQQCIAYYLGRVAGGDCPEEMIKLGMGRGHFRSLPLDGIEVGSQEAMTNISPQEKEVRNREGLQAFDRLNSHAARENFLRMAQRINAHLWAAPQGISGFTLDDDLNRKAVLVRDANGHIVRRFRFRLSRIRVMVENMLRHYDAFKTNVIHCLRSILFKSDRLKSYLSKRK